MPSFARSVRSSAALRCGSVSHASGNCRNTAFFIADDTSFLSLPLRAPAGARATHFRRIPLSVRLVQTVWFTRDTVKSGIHALSVTRGCLGGP